MEPLLPARVTAQGVFIGDQKLPGPIKDDGVTAQAEFGGVNTLTVTFFVDRVEFAGEDGYSPRTVEPGAPDTTFDNGGKGS